MSSAVPEVSTTTPDSSEDSLTIKTEATPTNGVSNEADSSTNGTSETNGHNASSEAEAKVEYEDEAEAEAAPSELEARIIRQVEYYFGDANLPRDNFLKEQVAKHEDGYVSLEVLTTFNRLAKLSKDTKVIATALRKSQSGLLEVHSDDSKIRRNPDRTLKVQNFKDTISRTLYLKGFPVETPVDEIVDYFDSVTQYEKVVIRRERGQDNKGKFKGSVFLIFKTDREAMNFLSIHKISENPVKLMFNDIELELCSKEEHSAKKAAEKSRNTGGAKPQPHEKKDDFDYSKCGILSIFEAEDDVSREDIKGVFKEFVTEALFITYNRGGKTGFLRFPTQELAETALNKAREKNEGKLITEKGEFQAEIITEAEVRERAIEVLKEDERQMNRHSQGHGHKRNRGGGGGHRGGRGRGGRGRGGGNWQSPVNREAGEPTAKKTKFDSDDE